ncbi:sigma-54 interaction domain-containing protein [Aneurinibacillus migulanus]|uniref:sigma-54 interaction domain-containing protein n=1 Tax=Aneurinibacillus migulanus TaxID=47500 RepID=UPI00069AA2E3|nr:sigma 54-interacting transcriptional regulator [Aneurinibacillus migulanus]
MKKIIEIEGRRWHIVKQAEMMVIFVGSHNQVVEWQGEVAEVFGFSPSVFLQPNMHIFQVPWETVVRNRPDLSAGLTIMQAINGPLVLLSVVKLPDTGSDIKYVLVLSRLDHMLDVNMNAPVLPDVANGVLVKSEKMKKIIDVIHKIASVDSTVLLLGESGVGKTMLARLIHQASSRKDAPFVSINCGTLPDSLIESELFGYESGTFTGGKTGGKQGLLEAAEGGTIFLDEIAELPYHVQSKLLEVLQENTFRKIGSVDKQKANIRILSATNKNLKEMVNQKRFREDLYYRLHVVPLMIPPLRERREEILPLIEHFTSKFNQKYDRRFFLSPQMKARLVEYEWPGNIRELENLVERIIVTQSEEIAEQVGGTSEDTDAFTSFQTKNVLPPLKEAKKQLEKALILRAYDLYENTYKAAEILQVDQSTIAKKLKQYRAEENGPERKRSTGK